MYSKVTLHLLNDRYNIAYLDYISVIYPMLLFYKYAYKYVCIGF